MSKDSVQIAQIEESLDVVYTAFCNGCSIETSSNAHESSFAKQLYAKGWRVNNNGDLLCQDCIKKYP